MADELPDEVFLASIIEEILANTTRVAGLVLDRLVEAPQEALELWALYNLIDENFKLLTADQIRLVEAESFILRSALRYVRIHFESRYTNRGPPSEW